MIVLDPHIWIWWVHGDARLTADQTMLIQEHEGDGLGVSIISCWEVAKLLERGRLSLPCAVADWFDQAVSYPGVQLLNLTTAIVVDSTQLPFGFHKDPADQLIVSTARIHGCPLLTADQKIISYPHVLTLT
ncbi:MAG TPA: type II toxin-antitoxin system VapC family toxin [Blastocatellia bacterium]|nr:type II toxin-antitoxin system VapC family toxin [Blastocatellia bacterium]